MSGVITVFKRELKSYFATPVAYVFIVIFLILSGAFTFYLGNFYERGQADLQPFFNFHPWLYLFLVPAVSMRLWAEERKSGAAAAGSWTCAAGNSQDGLLIQTHAVVIGPERRVVNV